MDEIKKSLTVLDYLSKYMIDILYIGVLFFLCGIYILPDGGDVTRVFYLLVAIPCFVIMMKTSKYLSIFSHELFLFMLFPVYLCISYLWAFDENTTRTFIFHLRNVFCVLLFLSSLCLIINKKQKFITHLLLVLFSVGSVSAIYSLLIYFYDYNFTIDQALMLPFTDNPNKSGAIYCLHRCLCLYLFFSKQSFVKLSARIFLIFILVVDVTVVFLSQAVVPLLVVSLFAVMLVMKNWPKRRAMVILLFISLVCFSIIYFSGYLELLFNMKRVLVRIELVRLAIEQMNGSYLFGMGLSYKLPLINPSFHETNPHPHNIFLDCFRFGGLVGLISILVQCFLIISSGLKSLKANDDIYFVICWFISGVILMSFYGQQPLTRPGGYIWFLYWMPGTILVASALVGKRTSFEDQVKMDDNR